MPEATIIEYAVEETELDNRPRYYLVEDDKATMELDRGDLPDEWPGGLRRRVKTFMSLLCSRFPPNDHDDGPVARLTFESPEDKTPTITEVGA